MKEECAVNALNRKFVARCFFFFFFFEITKWTKVVIKPISCV